MGSNTLNLSLSEIDGYQFNVLGNLNISGTTHYSNVLFETMNLNIDNSSINGQVVIYNNMVVSAAGLNQNSFATNMYTVFSSNPTPITDTGKATWASNLAIWDSNAI
jgi:hypothetical protein